MGADEDDVFFACTLLISAPFLPKKLALWTLSWTEVSLEGLSLDWVVLLLLSIALRVEGDLGVGGVGSLVS